MNEMRLSLPDDAVERIAERAAELVLARMERERTEAPGSPYLTIREAADLLRCSRQRVDNLLSARKLPRVKDGGRTLIPRQAIEQYLSGLR